MLVDAVADDDGEEDGSVDGHRSPDAVGDGPEFRGVGRVHGAVDVVGSRRPKTTADPIQ